MSQLPIRRAHLRRSAAAIVSLFLASSLTAQQVAGDSGRVVESGTFVLHKFEQAVGTETYQVRQRGDTLVMTTDFKFTDRGTEVPLTASFRARRDLTPLAFEIEGSNARDVEVDASVVVDGAAARVREGAASRKVRVPERFFTMAGYAPVSMQMMFVRWAAAHPGSGPVPLLPSGELTLERRGVDTVAVAEGRVALTRWAVGGLQWGREAVWTDAEGTLVATVGVDAEFDHFEAVRQGYEPALGAFIARAAEDGMAALAEIGRRISPETEGTLALVGATLIDGTGRPPVPDAVVVVRDGRIAAAGPRGSVAVPAGARVVDVAGKYLLPGLWDMHAHFQQVEWGPVYLAAGVTTVRDVGNELSFITAVRDAVAAGRGLGPRLLLAGIVDGDGPRALGVVRANTPEEARAVVRRYRDAGFQSIKIYSSVKPEVVAALAAEAHRLGMRIGGHVPQGMTAVQMVEMGVDEITHAQFLPQVLRSAGQPNGAPGTVPPPLALDSPQARAALALFRERGTVFDPTIALYGQLLRPVGAPIESADPGAAKLPAELRRGVEGSGSSPEDQPRATALLDQMREAVAALHRAGIPIVAGSDQGLVPGHTLHAELEAYVRAGMTPMQALQSATLVPARVMGMERELGTLEPGKHADLIVVDADPLASISNIRRVSAVLTAGRLYDTAPLWRSVGFAP